MAAASQLWPGETTTAGKPWPGEITAKPKPRAPLPASALWPGEKTSQASDLWPGEVAPKADPKPKTSSPPSSPLDKRLQEKPRPAKPNSQPGLVSRLASDVADTGVSLIEGAPGAAEGLYESVRHPVQALQGLSERGLGAARAGVRAVSGHDLKPIRKESPELRAAHAREDAAFRQDRQDYGSVTGFEHKLKSDPWGVIGDATLAYGGLRGGIKGAKGKLPGVPDKPIIKQVTRPEFVDAHSRRAAPVIARASSQADLSKQQLLASLQEHYKAFNGVDAEGMNDVKRYIEGQPTRKPLTPALQAAADHVKTVLGTAGQDLKGATGVPLRPNYYPHDWQDAKTRAAKTDPKRPSKVGSGKQTRARKITTVDDGLAAGLKERHAHPLDAVSHYLEDTYNRIGHERALRDLRGGKHAGWFNETHVPEGWTALEGPSTRKKAQPILRPDGTLKLTKPAQVLAAPDSVAALHNNRLARSLADTKVGPLYKPARAVTNAARTGLLAAGSMAHTVLTSGKAFGSELARGANEVLRGHPVAGTKALAHSFASPFTLVLKGSQMESDLLEHGPRTEEEKLLVDAGMRVKGSATYETNLKPSWYESARRRTFVQDLKKDFSEIGGAKGVMGKGKATAEMLGRAAKTANHFTFKYQVPAVKRGVAASELTDFLKNNPTATAAEKQAKAREIISSVDNRFGEMVADNNFWHTWYQEISRLALLSPSWVQGNVRLFGDAAKNIPASLKSALKGQGLGGDTSAMFGVYASRTLIAGMLTYALTKEVPSGMDWVAPRTGGKNPDGSPERMQVLSSMKDIDQIVYGGNIPDEIYGKLNPGLQTGKELLENRDYFGRDIYRPEGANHVAGDGNLTNPEYMAKYVWDRNKPIGMQGGNGPDSHLSSLAKLAGVMPAGQKYSNPEKREANQRKYGTAEWKRAVKSRRKEEQRKAQ